MTLIEAQSPDRYQTVLIVVGPHDGRSVVRFDLLLAVKVVLR